MCSDGYMRPIPDAGTPFRVELFTKRIPSSSATRNFMKPGTMVTTYLVNGMQLQVPNEQVTITDWARILVNEAASSVSSRRSAKVALQSLTVETVGAWTTAAQRLLVHMRAAEVDADRPFTSQETYFWRFINQTTLITVLERTVDMPLPKKLDSGNMQVQLMTYTRNVKELCTSHTVDFNFPLLIAMERRAQLLRQGYTDFVTDLSNRSHRFFTASEMKQRGAFSMGVISNRRPLDESVRTPVRGGGTKFNGKALIGALRGGEMNPEHAEQFAQIAAMLASSDDSPEHDAEQEESDEAEYPPLAAFNNRAASKPGATGTPFQSKTPKSTPADARSDIDFRPRKMRRPNIPPATQPVRGREGRDVEEVRLPAVGERDDVIFAALARLGVCFYSTTQP